MDSFYRNITKPLLIFILSLFPLLQYGQSLPDTIITVNYRFDEFQSAQNIQVEIRDGMAFIDDDILLGEAASFMNNTSRSAILTGNSKRWPNNTIPYLIPDSFTQRQAVLSAITHISSRTNLLLSG